MTVVVLSWEEIERAGFVAISRSVVNFQKERKDAHGLVYSGLGIEQHWQGAIGELAVVKYRQCDWEPLKFRAVDAGDVEVRSVSDLTRRLVIHPTDKDEFPFVLATVMREKLPKVKLRGWMLCGDAKRKEWWLDPQRSNRHAFFVPNEQLRPMRELP